MPSNTLRAGLLALVLFAIAAVLGVRYWTTPVDPDNGNLILDKDANMSGRVAEVAKLGELGPEAGPETVATLVSTLKETDPEVRAEAARALGRVGIRTPEARQALAAAAKDQNPGVRSAALAAANEQSRAAKADDTSLATYEAIVLVALKDPTPRVRQVAASTLRGRPEGSMKDVEAIVKAEIAALSDADPVTRTAAMAALRELPKVAGPKLNPGAMAAMVAKVPALIQGVVEGDTRSRPDFQGLLDSIGSAARAMKSSPDDATVKTIRNSLKAGLANPRSDVKTAVLPVVPSLSSLSGVDAAFLKDAYPASLAEKDPLTRSSAVDSLVDLIAQDDAIAPAAVELLRPLLKDDDPQVRAASYMALWSSPAARKAGGDALKAELREATRVWIADLSKPDPAAREVAAWGLSWTDPEDADAALAALRPLKDDEEGRVKRRVNQAIEGLEAAKAAGSWPEPAWKPFRSRGPAPGAAAASGG